MRNNMYDKYCVIGIIILLFGVFIIPGINGYNIDNFIKNDTSISMFNPSPEWNEQAKLLAIDGGEKDEFGTAVSIDGDYAFIGAPYGDMDGVDSGSVYVYKRNGANWVHQEKLTPDDGKEIDYFGLSISLDGDIAFIGAPGHNNGAVYVFVKDGDNWIQQEKIFLTSGSIKYFGGSVFVDGDTALIGSPEDNENMGSVYVFIHDGSGWVEQDTLLPSDGAKDDFFGCSVSLDGDIALVGAKWDDDNGVNSGSAYVFEREGVTWNQKAKLIASETTGAFGWSVSIDDDIAFIGAPGSDVTYVFSYDGVNWNQQVILVPSDGRDDSSFGFSVFLDGETAFVGSPVYGDYYGAVFVYKSDDSYWVEEGKLQASDGDFSDGFGWSVCFDEDYALIGALKDDDNGEDSGSAYIFKKAYPDLDCEGSITWIDVDPGETVEDGFTVENIGEKGSKLDWEITEWPEWGSWTFIPSVGIGLTPENGKVTVNVSVVAPNKKVTEFKGNITITNIENASDFCYIPVTLNTPRIKTYSFDFNLFSWLFEKFPVSILILMRLFGK